MESYGLKYHDPEDVEKAKAIVDEILSAEY
jgi:hypothetical protein